MGRLAIPSLPRQNKKEYWTFLSSSSRMMDPGMDGKNSIFSTKIGGLIDLLQCLLI